jgi:hypothetical protein
LKTNGQKTDLNREYEEVDRLSHDAMNFLSRRRCRANAERAPLGGCCCRRRLELQDTALQQYQLVAKRLFGTAPLWALSRKIIMKLRRRSPRLILPLLPLLLLAPVLPRLAPTFLLFFLVHHEQRVLRARVFRGTLATGRAAAVVHVVDERAGAASPGRLVAPRLLLLLLLVAVVVERRRGRGRDGGGGGGAGGGRHSWARELLRWSHATATTGASVNTCTMSNTA